MAVEMSKAKGKAQKGVTAYEYKMGENRIRLVGGVLPRYVYWVKSHNNRDIPIECLAFDREKERFTNWEIARTPRNAFRGSVVVKFYRGRATDWMRGKRFLPSPDKLRML